MDTMTNDPTEWRYDHLWFPRLGINGEKIWGNVMVRVVDAKRQYRRETSEEQLERMTEEAW